MGPWGRIEGSPLISEGESTKQTIAILGKCASVLTVEWSFIHSWAVAKEVSVAREVLIRSCIVLPQKTLDRSFANEVLL